jgi:hypothetical protein
MRKLTVLMVILAVGLAAPAGAQVTPDDLRPFIGQILVVETTTGVFEAFLVSVTGTGSGTARVVRCSAGNLFLSNLATASILDFEPSRSRAR